MRRTRVLVLSFTLLLALLAACNPLQTATSQPLPNTTVQTETDLPVSEEKPELENFFEGMKGAFVLYDLNGQKTIRFNTQRCAEPFLPASTFKILNALIGLETGVISDENYKIAWDGTNYEIASWNQDQTLATAFQNSVVWYYQELARRVGEERMRHYVELADYGNRDISGKIDTFWLEGGLRISADQQVDFLKRFYQNDLPFSTSSIDIVKKIMILESTDSYTFRGKTGSVQRVPIHTGWFVGYLERDGNVYFFATNIESTDPDGFASGAAAREITENILVEEGLLPPR
ncbi:beta-lactamase class D [Longilinea arvoryzae]|uniref:Beta-lactamase n=1 Tax=Longilinea arvoryzae TaxID=360412 RepID=A0A0S7BBD0_9CHLR|nr:carbapenem-hydrolyzing class D beta-lactamase OXA-1089 [Longilinea arvoryzae]GAP12525.1 beta-lactamase class D [Longilinea arvoryzae]